MQALEETDLDTDDPLIADGYAWEFAHQHECQHQETITELLQLITLRTERPEQAAFGREAGHAQAEPTAMQTIAGGVFRMGSDSRHSYDNEQDAHEVEVASFALDEKPVTGSAMAPVPAGGRVSKAGTLDAGRLAVAGAGKRDRSGVLDADTGRKSFCLRRGRAACARSIRRSLPAASVGTRPTPTPAGSANASRPRPNGSSPPGIWTKRRGMSGSGTASPFLPYPGFQAFPYDGYSLEHMDGKHFVCRGGSWATDACIRRRTFRNWYVPTYRQGLLGVRCAR